MLTLQEKNTENTINCTQNASFWQLNLFSAEINWTNIHQSPSNIDWKELIIDQENSGDKAENNFNDVLLVVCLKRTEKKKNTQNKQVLLRAKNAREKTLNKTKRTQPERKSLQARKKQAIASI